MIGGTLRRELAAAVLPLKTLIIDDGDPEKFRLCTIIVPSGMDAEGEYQRTRDAWTSQGATIIGELDTEAELNAFLSRGMARA